MNDNQVAWGRRTFVYNEWAWALLKPADLFTAASGLTPTEERVAMRLWAHANTRTGFTYVTAGRISALLARDIDGARRGVPVNNVNAARAELRRRRFIERAYEGGHKGWRLLSSDNWLLASESLTDQERGKKSRAVRLIEEGKKSPQATRKVVPGDFRETADIIEGRNQLTIQYTDNGAGTGSGIPTKEASPPSLVSEMIGIGMPADDATSLVNEFSLDVDKLRTALANLALDLRSGKQIRSARGYVADQILKDRPAKRGLHTSSTSNIRRGELPASEIYVPVDSRQLTKESE